LRQYLQNSQTFNSLVADMLLRISTRWDRNSLTSLPDMAVTPPVFKTDMALSEFLWASDVINFVQIDQNIENMVKALCTTSRKVWLALH
jgi:hypothetical protein